MENLANWWTSYLTIQPLPIAIINILSSPGFIFDQLKLLHWFTDVISVNISLCHVPFLTRSCTMMLSCCDGSVSVLIYNRAHCTDVSIGRKKLLHNVHFTCSKVWYNKYRNTTLPSYNLIETFLLHFWSQVKWTVWTVFFFFSASLLFAISIFSPFLQFVSSSRQMSTMWVCFAPVRIIWAKLYK